MIISGWEGKPKEMTLRDAIQKAIWNPLCRTLKLPDDIPLQEDFTGLEKRGSARFVVALTWPQATQVVEYAEKSEELFVVPLDWVNEGKAKRERWVRVIPGAKVRRIGILKYLERRIKESLKEIIDTPTEEKEIKGWDNVAQRTWFLPSGMNTGFCYVPEGKEIASIAEELRVKGEPWTWIHLQDWWGRWILQPAESIEQKGEFQSERREIFALIQSQGPLKWTKEMAEKIIKGLPLKKDSLKIFDDKIEAEFESGEAAKTFYEFTWGNGRDIFSISHPWLDKEMAEKWETERDEEKQMRQFKEARKK